MPPIKINWSDWVSEVGSAFSESLYPVLKDVWDEAQEDIERLGKRAAKYLKAIAQGDSNAEVALASVRRQAALIASRYLRDMEVAAQQAFLNGVEIALKILAKVILAAMA